MTDPRLIPLAQVGRTLAKLHPDVLELLRRALPPSMMTPDAPRDDVQIRDMDGCRLRVCEALAYYAKP